MESQSKKRASRTLTFSPNLSKPTMASDSNAFKAVASEQSSEGQKVSTPTLWGPSTATISDAGENDWDFFERDSKSQKAKATTQGSFGSMTASIKEATITQPAQPKTGQPTSSKIAPPMFTFHATSPSEKKSETHIQNSGEEEANNHAWEAPIPRRKKSTFRPEVVTSYRQLFNGTDTGSFYNDRTVLLQPYNRLTYFVQTVFEKVEFQRYAWLFAQYEDRWYSMPSPTALARMRRDGLEKLKPIADPKPVAMRVPRVVAGDGLYLEDYGEEEVAKTGWGCCKLLHPDDEDGIDGEDGLDKSRNGSDNESDGESLATSEHTGVKAERPENRKEFGKWACEKCFRKNKQLYDEIGWIYLSVVRTDQQTAGAESEGDGSSMYMVRKSGSRERVAAQAFYDAGARGWDTVFFCGMRADVEMLGWKGKVQKFENCIQYVLAKEEGVLRIFT